MTRSYKRDDAAAAVKRQRERTIALLESIGEARWEEPVTPGWRVREVAAHLIATDEAALTGRMVRLGLSPVPVEELESWNETQVRRWSDRPIPALLHGLDVWGRRLVRVLTKTPVAIAEHEIPTPFGHVSPAWLGMMRVYDEWIHGEDVRAALEVASDDAREAVEPVATHLFEVIPVQTIPRLPASATGSVALRIRDFPLPPFGLDLTDRRFGPAVTETAARIEADARPMVMIASGRRAWREAEGAGELVIAGDRAPAEVLLDALIAV